MVQKVITKIQVQKVTTIVVTNQVQKIQKVRTKIQVQNVTTIVVTNQVQKITTKSG